MIEIFRFFKSLTTKKQRYCLYTTITLPMIVSGFLFLLSIFFHIEIIDVRLKQYLIFMWINSIIFFSSLLLIFSFFCSRNPDFQKNKMKIANSTIQLLKYRLKKTSNFMSFLCIMVFCFYVLNLIPIITSFYKNNLNSSIITIIPLLFIFLLFYFILRNIFMGFRENFITRYFPIIFLLSIWIIYFWLNLNIKFYDIFNMTNFANWMVPVLLGFLFTLILPVIQGNLKKIYPKRKIAEWEKSILPFDIFSECMISFGLFGFLIILNLYLAVIDSKGSIIQSLTIIIIIFYVSILFIYFLYLKFLSDTYIKKIINWDEFFKCYTGSVTKKLDETHSKLTKISGKCKAISINEKYRDKFEYFNQHFLLQIDNSEDTIDVISLNEKIPFKNSETLVREFDEIIVVGEIKSVLDDDILKPKENRISKLILAHHIESKNK